VLDVWYSNPKLGARTKTDALWVVPRELDSRVGPDPRRNVTLNVVRTEIDLTLPVVSTAERLPVRLHLLSHLSVKPNAVRTSTDVIAKPYRSLPFTNIGPVALNDYEPPTPQRYSAPA
jgi:2,3,4,5-tetrahydropyridine-2-carboxylate N-succinyltransferase